MTDSEWTRSERLGALVFTAIVTGVGFVERDNILENIDCPSATLGINPNVVVSAGDQTLTTAQDGDLKLSVNVDQSGQPSLVAEGPNVYDVGIRGCRTQDYFGEMAPDTHEVRFLPGDAGLLTYRVHQGSEVVRGTLRVELSGAGAVDGIVSTAVFGPTQRGLVPLAKEASPDLGSPT